MNGVSVISVVRKREHHIGRAPYVNGEPGRSHGHGPMYEMAPGDSKTNEDSTDARPAASK